MCPVQGRQDLSPENRHAGRITRWAYHSVPRAQGVATDAIQKRSAAERTRTSTGLSPTRPST